MQAVVVDVVQVFQFNLVRIQLTSQAIPCIINALQTLSERKNK